MIIAEVGKDYVKQWKDITDKYENGGFYEAITKQLNLPSRRLWVDACCGLGNLIAVGSSKTSATIVGFDFNPESLKTARDRLSANTSLKYRINGKWSIVPLSKDGYKIQEGINLVLDDLSPLRILKSYLKETPIDLLTLSCPGVPDWAKYKRESDYSQGIPHEEYLKRTARLEHEIKRNLFKNTKQMLDDNVTVVLIERAFVPVRAGDPDMTDHIVSSEVNSLAEENGFVNTDNRFVRVGVPVTNDPTIPFGTYQKDEELLLHMLVHFYSLR